MSINYAAKLTKSQKDSMEYGVCGDKEIVESPATLASKVVALADLLRNCRRCVVHTGAGISTSAGIPDFRGKNGVWTCEKTNRPPPAGVSFEQAVPTPTHMAIAALLEARMVHHVVTQNVDGLHLKSGMKRDQLSEIHGTTFALYCYECGTEYASWHEIDSFGCTKTSRTCPRKGCGELLHDRICSWENVLPIQEMRRAQVEHKRADLTIVLGSSLRVNPACDLLDLTLAVSDQGEGRFHPTTGKWEVGKARGEKGKVVIVNLQATTKEFDSQASLRIHGRCDDVMTLLIAELGINQGKIKPWDRETARAAFDAHCARVLREATATPRSRNNGRWVRGHPPTHQEDVRCYVCNGPEGRASFILCAECDSGLHRTCLGGKRPRREEDFYCMFCVTHPLTF